MSARRDRRSYRDTDPWVPWRWPIEMAATIQEQASCPLDVTIVDLSLSGCRLRAGFRLTAGRPARLVIAGFAPLRGHVVWAENWHAAMRFDQHIHTSVLTHLVARHPPQPTPRLLGDAAGG